jgi:hypothetical protein
VNRWHAITEPQHLLSAVAACAFGTTRRVSDERLSKPEHRERHPAPEPSAQREGRLPNREGAFLPSKTNFTGA